MDSNAHDGERRALLTADYAENAENADFLTGGKGGNREETKRG
jgi:hypothetical protein